MNDFSLIKQLEDLDNSGDKSSSPSVAIKYQQYELDVEKRTQKVNIPLREAEAFEEAITSLSEPLTRDVLRRLLREFRGVRG